jgi:hypothetical protein
LTFSCREGDRKEPVPSLLPEKNNDYFLNAEDQTLSGFGEKMPNPQKCTVKPRICLLLYYTTEVSNHIWEIFSQKNKYFLTQVFPDFFS